MGFFFLCFKYFHAFMYKYVCISITVCSWPGRMLTIKVRLFVGQILVIFGGQGGDFESFQRNELPASHH